jgi:hypothetical protein
MSNHFQFCRQASWAMLFVTFFLAFLLCLILGMAAGFLAFLQHLFFPGAPAPWHLERIRSLALSILVPVFFLGPFYMVTATRVPKVPYWIIGWIASAAYHGALTWLLMFHLPGTLQTSGGSSQMPLSVLSGAAFVASVYLLIRYPRPPRLPPDYQSDSG